MKKIEWWLETPTGITTDEVEVPDESNEEEIDAVVGEEVFNLVSWGWRKKE